ncbi:hypothetical protein CYL18_06795 [Pradoshia eiseniae]|uniref:PepSY domain-containing protein n=1 Tax=Pradoshia eiseniae TaxID=2064768 RepID=A0A2S7N2R8_9BACI|nr:PepSY domain-containing protein [Pradoshia eiseniae]PQD96295.1 hypothetical protein CYL18_06795 [Pradoshia eiseniae]
MSKKHLWIMPALLLICIILCAVYAYNQIISKTTFGEAEIKNRVSSLYNGEIQAIAKKKNQYEVTFRKNDFIYQVLVNEEEGTFSDLKVIKEGAKEEIDTPEESPAEQDELKPLTKEEVVKIARSQFEGSVDDVEFIATDDGGYYNVDLENQEDEATLQIHALTGEIITITYDD